MKRILCACMALMLLAAPALAEGALTVGATVVAAQEIALGAPMSGVLEPFDCRVGEKVAPGDTLFTVRPTSVYATLDGTVAAVYAKNGASADAAVSRYGAVVAIERAERYELTANIRSGYNSDENRNPFVGTQVWLRSNNKKHFADGVITAVNGKNVTVQVLGGDLVFTEDASVYLDAEYTDKKLLMKGALNAVQPENVTASGTVLEMKVQKGDAVRAGQLLFTYAPDALVSNGAPLNEAKPDTAGIITSVSATTGMSVQKNQALCSYVPFGAYELSATVEESELANVLAGGAATVTFDELQAEPMQALVASIAYSANTDGKYEVRLSFDAPEALLESLRLGMHATVVFGAAE